MKDYANKEAIVNEIRRTSELFINEFHDVEDKDSDCMMEGVDRTPKQMLAYQLGWMQLLLSWDRDELAGLDVITPAPGYKWNKLGGLYQEFYDTYEAKSMKELIQLYRENVDHFCAWVNNFEDQELFVSGARGWADSTASKWPVWKWIHINTVGPFTSFRSKIRKWKKMKNS